MHFNRIVYCIRSYYNVSYRIVSYRTSMQTNPIILYRIVSYCFVFVSYRIVSYIYANQLYYIVSYRIVLFSYRIVSYIYANQLYYIISYRIVLFSYRIVLFSNRIVSYHLPYRFVSLPYGITVHVVVNCVQYCMKYIRV